MLNLSHFHLEMQENFQENAQTFLEGKQIAREGLNEPRVFSSGVQIDKQKVWGPFVRQTKKVLNCRLGLMIRERKFYY